MPWHDLPLGQPRGRGAAVAVGLAGLLGLAIFITSRGGGGPSRPSPCPPLGDPNGDGKVDQNTIDLMTANFGQLVNGDPLKATLDLNGDGIIDVVDVSILNGFLAGEINTFPACNGNGGGGGGASTPAGAIANITLSQPQPRRFLGNARPGQSVRMGQDVPKKSTDTIQVSYFAQFSTKNAQGQAISWPYRIETRLINGTDLQQIGVTLFWQSTVPNGGLNRHDTHAIPQATPVGTGIYAVVEMFVAKSDASGNPTSQMMLLQSVTSSFNNIVRIV